MPMILTQRHKGVHAHATLIPRMLMKERFKAVCKHLPFDEN